jgi:restriction system protein
VTQTAWQHTCGASLTDAARSALNGPNSFPSSEEYFDPINCIYCGSITNDYPCRDYWQLTFEDFNRAHRPTARIMKRQMGVPARHVQPSGDLCDRHSVLHICPMCGWWLAVDRATLPAIEWQLWHITLISTAVLQELDVSDINIPVSEVRRYLMRRFEARHSLHPRVFEETVASVFTDHGYTATATAYTCDGGIDVVLVGNKEERIGIQVKRHKRSIQVEQIRAFLGALTLGGYTRGIFVASSKFQRGAKSLASYSTARHIPIELMDAARFFEALGVAQLNNAPTPEDCGFAGPLPLKFSLHSDFHLNSL